MTTITLLLFLNSSFLLTHPVWDVTPVRYLSGVTIVMISTHTSRVGCDAEEGQVQAYTQISTHTSRVGCDVSLDVESLKFFISTHTSRVGCDYWCNWCYWLIWKFLLTHPVWDVTTWSTSYEANDAFLLTHPVWDVTYSNGLMYPGDPFLLTHPVWDVTICSVGYTGNSKAFLLTHPVWDVTKTGFSVGDSANISTHTSRVGCDFLAAVVAVVLFDFYSHIPCGM